MRADRPSQRRAYLERLRRGNPGTNQNAMQKRIERGHGKPYYPDLARGRDVQYGGAKELDFETMNPLMQGLAIAVIIVFFFLLVNFKKIGWRWRPCPRCCSPCSGRRWACGRSISISA